MAFGEKEREFLKLCTTCPPNIEAVRRFLVSEKIDINAVDENDEDSDLLSSFFFLFPDEAPEDCFQHNKSYLVELTRLFLEHGFDVRRNGGRVGANCLDSLMFNYSGEELLQTASLLLEAGLDPCYYFEEDGETLLQGVWFKYYFLTDEGDVQEAKWQLQLYELLKTAAGPCLKKAPPTDTDKAENSGAELKT